MPNLFTCPGCKTLMQAGDDAIGKQVRCPKCQTISIVPAPPPVPAPPVEPAIILDEVEPVETAIADKPPEKPRKKTSPVVSGRQYHDEELDEADKKKSKPQVRARQPKAQSVVVPMIALGGFFVLILGCLGTVGFGGWYLISSNDGRDRMAEGPQPAGLPPGRENIGKILPPVNGGNPQQPPGGGFPGEQPFNGDPQQPPPPPPPIKLVLNNGKIETNVVLVIDQNAAPTERYEFEAKADTVYWVKCDDVRNGVKVVGPDGQRVDRAKDRTSELAFLTVRAGVHIITVEGNILEANRCKLSLREMDGTEPLHQGLRLTTEAPELPKLTTAFEKNQIVASAAFSPDNKGLWISYHSSTLEYWDNSEKLRKGNYTLGVKDWPEGLHALGVDREGRLYGQLAKGDPNHLFDRGDRKVSDIQVWERLAPEKDNLPMPVPTMVIPLKGVVQRFINSPDGRWLYYLDINNRKLGRIDPDKVAIDKEIEDISPGTRSFCIAADGKRIYCCSESNRIDVIDAATFKLEASVKLDRGQPTDIAATNSRLVYLVGGKSGDQGRADNIMVVDLTAAALPQEARVIVLPQWIYCSSVQVLPDQRAVLFAGDRRIFVYSIPTRPALFNPVFREMMVTDYFTPGDIFVSPDSRTVIYDRGILFSVSR